MSASIPALKITEMSVGILSMHQGGKPTIFIPAQLANESHCLIDVIGLVLGVEAELE